MGKLKNKLVFLVIIFILMGIFGPVGGVKVFFGIIGLMGLFLAGVFIWIAKSWVEIEIELWKKNRLELSADDYSKWKKERYIYGLKRFAPLVIYVLLAYKCASDQGLIHRTMSE